jgi:hypothetical protein
VSTSSFRAFYHNQQQVSKMRNNNNINNNLGVTTRYKYGNDDSEYIFTCKGRPFAVLASAHLPTPTSPLLDYDLVRSLGLKMTDHGRAVPGPGQGVGQLPHQGIGGVRPEHRAGHSLRGKR